MLRLFSHQEAGHSLFKYSIQSRVTVVLRYAQTPTRSKHGNSRYK